MKKYVNTISAFQFYQLVKYSTLILIGVVFTKTALTQKAIGEYETFVLLGGAVSFFWLNGLLKALLPLAAAEKKSNAPVFSSFVLIQFFSLVAATTLFFGQSLFSDYLLHGKAIPEIKWLLAFVAIAPPATLAEYYYLIKKKNRAIAVYAIVSFFVQFILVVLPALLGEGIEMALKGLVISSALRYFWLLATLIANKETTFSAAFVKEHLKLGAPLIAATFLSGSAQFADGFIVTSKFDERTFAIFRYGARELPLAMLLANALSSAMLPDFANKNQLSQNLKKLKKSISRLADFLFPLTAVLLLISHPVFPVVFNPGFAESASVFNIYLLLIISRLMLPQTILNGLKFSKPILNASLFELILNVTLSLIFVRFWGIQGIAFATFLAYLFEKIYLAVAVKQLLDIRVKEYLPVKIYAIYSVVTVLIFIFAELIY